MLLGDEDEDRELAIYAGKIQSLLILVTGRQWSGLEWALLEMETVSLEDFLE